MVRRRSTKRRRTYRRTYRARRRTVRGHGAYYSSRRRAPVRRRRATRKRSTAGKVLSGTKGVADYIGIPALFGSFAKGFGSHIASTAGGLLGTALAAGDLLSYVPGPIGLVSKLGTSLARAVTGHGAYHVKSNSLMGAMTANGPPRIKNPGTPGGFRVAHREYLFDLATGQGTPTAFNNQPFYLNPGLSSTFPWLSTIAGNFEQYRIHGMLVEYKTLSVDAINSTSVNLGAVIIATDYNALHAPFPSKQIMENYEFCSSAKPSLSMLHPIECAAHQTPIENLYIRTDDTYPVGADPRLYDLGVINIATQGLPAPAAAIGEIWVSYDIEFFKPNVPNPLNSDTNDTVLHFSATAFTNWNSYTGAIFGYGLPSVGGLNPAFPTLDTQTPMNSHGGNPMSTVQFNNGYVSNATGTTFQPGQLGIIYNPNTPAGVNTLYFMYDTEPRVYTVIVMLTATGTASSTGPITRTLTNCTVGNLIFGNYGSPAAQTPSSSTTTLYSYYSTTIFTPALGSSTAGYNCASMSLAITWSLVPSNTDIFVYKIS